MIDGFDYNNTMASLYPDTEYIINKSAYDCGVEGVKEEIVRCKYCEYFYTNNYGDQCCSNNYAGLWDGTPDSFCSWGKRKTN